MALKEIVDQYKKSINYKEGTDGMRSEMDDFMFSEFPHAPNYYKLKFSNEQGNEYDIDVRVQNSKNSNTLEILTLPQERNLAGNTFTYNDKEWLVYDYNDVDKFPKIIALRLNRILSFNHEGEVKTFPCSLINVRAQTLFQDSVISLPQGQLEVVAQRNKITELVKPKTRFLLNTSVYEVESVDIEGKEGVISFIMSVVNRRLDDRTEKEKVTFDELWSTTQ